MNYWPLLGVAVVVIGFAFKRNPVLVVVVAGIVSGLAAGMAPGDLLALLGTSFIGNRVLLLFVLTLPVIGLLEHAGLRETRTRMDRPLSRPHAHPISGLVSGFSATVVDARPDQRAGSCTNRAPAGRANERGRRRAHVDATLARDERLRVRALAAATDNVGCSSARTSSSHSERYC